jgi:hypothetical protein
MLHALMDGPTRNHSVVQDLQTNFRMTNVKIRVVNSKVLPHQAMKRNHSPVVRLEEVKGIVQQILKAIAQLKAINPADQPIDKEVVRLKAINQAVQHKTDSQVAQLEVINPNGADRVNDSRGKATL